METKASINELVAEEIRVLLARRRLSASDLARMTGMTQRAISRRLTGDKVIDVDDLGKIAAALGVEVTDLFPREGRVVVFADGTRRQTTGPYSPVARTAYPNGQAHRPAPSPASRRLARVAQVRS